jgi:plasmid maintenance system antidote protein VapI
MKIHPGETLLEMMQDRGLTVETMIQSLNMPKYYCRWEKEQTRVLNKVISGEHGISYYTANLLANIFPEVGLKFWLNLQKNYDEEEA